MQTGWGIKGTGRRHPGMHGRNTGIYRRHMGFHGWNSRFDGRQIAVCGSFPGSGETGRLLP